MNGFTVVETNRNTAFLKESALSAMKTIVNFIIQSKVSVMKPVWLPLISATTLTEEVAAILTSCWKDPLVKRVFAERVKHGINELPANTSYYFDNCERFAHPNFVPSFEDTLQIHIPTTGISEITFTTPFCHNTLVDVGGSATSRRKWSQIDSDSLTGVVFFVSLDSYGIPTQDGTSNDGLLDSLELFQEITRSPVYTDLSWTLVLNKADLFSERLSKTHLHQVYKNVSSADGEKFEPAVAYILSTFTRVYGGKKPLSHIVCSVTDHQQIGKIGQHIFQHILSQQPPR